MVRRVCCEGSEWGGSAAAIGRGAVGREGEGRSVLQGCMRTSRIEDGLVGIERCSRC